MVMLDRGREETLLLGICFLREAPETAVGRIGLPVEAFLTFVASAK